MSLFVDHHVHLFSPAAAELGSRASGRSMEPRSATDYREVMRDDGVDLAHMLSVAYFFSCPEAGEGLGHLAAAENDWLATQVDNDERLFAYFSLNPLDAAMSREFDRCTARGCFAGVKLHLANSDVDLRDRTHRAALRTVIDRAAAADLAVVVHLRTRRPDYGRVDAELFLDEVVAGARPPRLQIAHLGGWGGYDQATDDVLAVFAMTATNEPNLYVDTSGVVVPDELAKLVPGQLTHAALATRLATFPSDRVLFGTDWPATTPKSYARALRNALAAPHNKTPDDDQPGCAPG